MENNRCLNFEVNTTICRDTNTVICINYEFDAVDDTTAELVERICIDYSVTVDASCKEAVLQLYHLISDIVASEELTASEKFDAVSYVRLKIRRITHLLIPNKLYKVTYSNFGRLPLEVGIVSAANILSAVDDFVAGKMLGTELQEIQHAENFLRDLDKIERVSLYDACKTILDI